MGPKTLLFHLLRGSLSLNTKSCTTTGKMLLQQPNLLKMPPRRLWLMLPSLEDWKAQGNTIAALEKLKKTLEGQNHALAMKLDDAEAAALKGSKKAVAALKAQYDSLNADYEAQGKDYANLNKNFRKQERKMKELAFQADEDAKNNTRMQELVSKLQGKLKQYKLQSEEAEALANDNLLKYRRALNESSAAEERADAAEAALNKMRLQSRH